MKIEISVVSDVDSAGEGPVPTRPLAITVLQPYIQLRLDHPDRVVLVYAEDLVRAVKALTG